MNPITRVATALVMTLTISVLPTYQASPDTAGVLETTTAAASPLATMSESQARGWIRYGNGTFECTPEASNNWRRNCNSLLFTATEDTLFFVPGDFYANTPATGPGGRERGRIFVPCNTQITLRPNCGC